VRKILASDWGIGREEFSFHRFSHHEFLDLAGDRHWVFIDEPDVADFEMRATGCGFSMEVRETAMMVQK
jgi:hypothetical protein